MANPSFGALSNNRTMLYFVEEGQEGQVRSFRRNAANASITEINALSSQGENPCHLSLSPNEWKILSLPWIRNNKHTSANFDRIALNSATTEAGENLLGSAEVRVQIRIVFGQPLNRAVNIRLNFLQEISEFPGTHGINQGVIALRH